ncbi:beta-ketoacyl-[acyl-carrier-protein] synthase family protein [Myxococcota bacterium]|nr:beta-ketoacyl-[acyl-carrier-protein] synthase family protein [Myxococcota bacterium]
MSSIGSGREPFWRALLQGRSGISEVAAFDTSAFRTHRGGEIRGFSPLPWLSEAEAASMGRGGQLAVAAAGLALADAGLPSGPGAEDSDTGVCIGTTMGEIQVMEEAARRWNEGGLAAVRPEDFRRYPSGTIGRGIAARFGCAGPVSVVPTACAAGNYAIGIGADWIRGGRAVRVLAGGVDPMSLLAFAGFLGLRSMASERVRPFDRERRGMMVAEGAGVVVLEPLEAALARGATPYAEVLALGLACDAHHMTQPHPEGAGAAAAMRQALDLAACDPGAVDHVSAHGTGTPANDRAESAAILSVFGERGPRVPVTSLKGALGHTMGAASALEAIAACLTVADGLVPPTVGYEVPDPDCPLDVVCGEPRPGLYRRVLSNAFAFGGHDSALLLGAVA